MSEIEKLKKNLEELGVTNFNVSWGEDAHKYSKEQLAAEINKSLERIKSGDCKEAFDIEYGLEFDSREDYKLFYSIYPQPKWDESNKDSFIFRENLYKNSLNELHEKFTKQLKQERRQ